jgi:hypothetical protein
MVTKIRNVLDMGLFDKTSTMVLESQSRTCSRMTAILSYIKGRMILFEADE